MKKSVVVILSIGILSILCGCDNQSILRQNESDDVNALECSKDTAVLINEECDKLSEILGTIHKNSQQMNASNRLSIQQKMIQELEKNGYVAVDSKNQLNMVNSEQVDEFCQTVENRETAHQVVILLLETGDISFYEFQTENGSVTVNRNSLTWADDELVLKDTSQFQADTWIYTGNYLFFEQYHMAGYDGVTGHRAFRVSVLNDDLRKLNQIYLNPIGYDMNNMFITDWSESDYNELDFYDIYENLYELKTGKTSKTLYTQQGIDYPLPAQDFESIMQSYFAVSAQELRKRTDYNASINCYIYHIRTIHDFGGGPDGPYPEVTSKKENEDGTFTLTVNAVWPEKNLGNAISHEVTIRPMPDGTFQYVSNHVMKLGEISNPVWYTKRLKKEEWNEYYAK